MNLDRALILLLASVSAVSGFAPGFTSRQTSRVVSGSTLFSDEAAVSTDAETPAAAVEEPQSTYDTQIYVGNISFDTVESDLRAAFQEHGIYDTLCSLADVLFSVLIPWSQKWVFYVGETHFQGNGLESGLNLPRTVGATKICQEKLHVTFAILSSFLNAKSG